MRTQSIRPSSTLHGILITIVLMTGIALLIPRPAEAQLIVRIHKQPVRIISAPRVQVGISIGSHRTICRSPHDTSFKVKRGRYAKSLRTVTGRRCGNEYRPRNDHHVWVPGQWIRTGPRQSRWIPGHWVRV